ncbi:hypothetical protein AAFF_G00089770 [Aldrovandia affinis]|uniref:Uncharacterized protein n=1 Tax=Aldrovandia affinis TaxID=143900 RepID=A0AAD7WBU7_9TELE|nr:hypothetical protein AAFF_G00089770 [Aldrovandia affinis]
MILGDGRVPSTAIDRDQEQPPAATAPPAEEESSAEEEWPASLDRPLRGGIACMSQYPLVAYPEKNRGDHEMTGRRKNPGVPDVKHAERCHRCRSGSPGNAEPRE